MAARAGVPRATLYYYFSGREELLDFLLLEKVEHVGASMLAAASDPSEPPVRLEMMLSTAMRTMAAQPTLCTVLIARLAALAPTDLLSVAVDRAVLKPLRDLLDAGVAAGSFTLDDAEMTAHALYGAVSMAALFRFNREGHINANQLTDALVPRLVASVMAPKAGAPAAR